MVEVFKSVVVATNPRRCADLNHLSLCLPCVHANPLNNISWHATYLLRYVGAVIYSILHVLAVWSTMGIQKMSKKPKSNPYMLMYVRVRGTYLERVTGIEGGRGMGYIRHTQFHGRLFLVRLFISLPCGLVLRWVLRDFTHPSSHVQCTTCCGLCCIRLNMITLFSTLVCFQSTMILLITVFLGRAILPSSVLLRCQRPQHATRCARSVSAVTRRSRATSR